MNWVTESTDLPLQKNKDKPAKQPKAKVALTFQGTQLVQGGTSWHPSVESEEANGEDSLIWHASTTIPIHILEPAAVDSSDSEDDILREKPDNGCTSDDIVEEPVECAAVELGKSFSQVHVIAVTKQTEHLAKAWTSPSMHSSSQSQH